MLEAGRRSVTLIEMTSTSERALAAAQLRRSKIKITLSLKGFLSRRSSQVTLASTAASRRSARASACLRPLCCRLPRLT